MAWLTVRDVEEEALGSVVAPPVPSVIWVSEPDSFSDVIGFWNARALVATATSGSVGAVTAILLPPDVSGWLDLVEMLKLRFRARYQRPRPDAFIFSHTVPQAGLRAIAAQLNLTEVDPPVAQEHAAPGSLDTEPNPLAASTAVVGLDPTPWCCYPRRYGRATRELVQVFSGRTIIRAASPVPFRLGTGGWVKVSLSGLRALAAPRRATVARLFAPDAWFSGDRLSLKRATMNTYEITVTIPEPAAILTAALRDVGVTFTLSDKGKYAQALLALTRKRTDRLKADLEDLFGDKSGDTW